MIRPLVVLTFLIACVTSSPMALAGNDDADDLMDLSLEELLDVEITSVSKRGESLFQAAAAIHVITRHDIARSGVTSIPELLRRVPGMEVARFDSNKWAITARGFNDRFANKLLVLVDGRSIYTPTFGGIHWDIQHLLLENIERIEVIRGPGGTIWGANAVNGIINILTRNSEDTHGTLIKAGAGTHNRALLGAMHGGAMGQQADYRISASFRDLDALLVADDDSHDDGHEDGNDDWSLARIGARFDWKPSDRDVVVVDTGYFQGDVGEQLDIPILVPPFITHVSDKREAAGGHLRTAWRRTLSGGGSIDVQFYYDQSDRDSLLAEETRDTLDLEARHDFTLGGINHVSWGAGYRVNTDSLAAGLVASFDPEDDTQTIWNLFLQDELSLLQDRLHVIVGTKIENNEYTDTEVQPSARLSWKLSPAHVLWLSGSRAVRIPDRSARTVRANATALPDTGAGMPLLVTFFSSPDFDSEEVIMAELGYRWQQRGLAIDIAAFRAWYADVRTIEPGDPFVETTPEPTHLTVPLRYGNSAEADSHGVELMFRYEASDSWNLKLGYSFFDLEVELPEDSLDPITGEIPGQSPKHQALLGIDVVLPAHIELGLFAKYVDELERFEVPSYTSVAVHSSWRPIELIELSITGQNLLEDEHIEFGTDTWEPVATIERSFDFNVRLSF